jgi:hypothetical protein
MPVTSLPTDFVAYNIFPAEPCNHGPIVAYKGRHRVAHSLLELKNLSADRQGITVASTLGSAEARSEVEAYVVKEKMLGVKRADEQCIYYTMKMVHTTGALVVIC